ncbi:hypothetical protein Nepgr_022856 [Nepenthes gracilis]|uniref:Uncharacterized protein n=1 Tax=Nepenthes gracilis TaxID=150966 RepID=A0AAD3XYH4_NEPGR|nr:hypothetical protein Nepgr_022856 [Nepenthes gracilis]
MSSAKTTTTTHHGKITQKIGSSGQDPDKKSSSRRLLRAERASRISVTKKTVHSAAYAASRTKISRNIIITQQRLHFTTALANYSRGHTIQGFHRSASIKHEYKYIKLQCIHQLGLRRRQWRSRKQLKEMALHCIPLQSAEKKQDPRISPLAKKSRAATAGYIVEESLFSHRYYQH